MSWIWTDCAEPKPGERLSSLKRRAKPLSALLGLWFHPSHPGRLLCHARGLGVRDLSAQSSRISGGRNRRSTTFSKAAMKYQQNSSPSSFLVPCSHLMYSHYLTVFTMCVRGVRGGILVKSFREDYSLRTAPAPSSKSMWSAWLKVLFGKSNSIDQKLEVEVKGACLFEVYPAGFWFISSK